MNEEQLAAIEARRRECLTSRRWHEKALLIAHDDVPDLIDEIRRLRTELFEISLTLIEQIPHPEPEGGPTGRVYNRGNP